MSFLMIAEVLAGEALMTPGGAVDRLTAVADDVQLWPWLGLDAAGMAPAGAGDGDLTAQPPQLVVA